MRFEGHFESVKNLWHPSIGTKISHADNPWLHSVCYWSEINKIINEEKNQGLSNPRLSIQIKNGLIAE